MKRNHTLLVILFLFGIINVSAQTYLNEDFSAGVMPPDGWSIDENSANWSTTSSANAGGSAPEARFSWSPQFNGSTYLISPVIDLTGVDFLSISFKHMVDHYGGAYSIGLASRARNGEWEVVWSIENPSSSVGPEEQSIVIDNATVGSSDFQFAFFFSGDSYNINYWYLDDVRLFTPFPHDASVKDIPGGVYYTSGDTYTPLALVKNSGTNEETFDVSCEIYDYDQTLIHSDTRTVENLAAGEELELSFTDCALETPNMLYTVVVTTILSGDEDPSNDSMSKNIFTYTSDKQMVVLEIGTGTWCGYCPGAAMGADDLVENGHDVAVIEYHNGDDYANTASDARIDFYGITGFPTAVFNGVERLVGGSSTQSMYDDYLPIYDNQKQIKTAFSLDMYGSHDNLDYTVFVDIAKLGPALNENLVLHLALTESHIAENWGGLNELNFVERLMAPDHNGTAIDMLTNDELTVELQFSVDGSWDLEHCELVCFVQDLNTLEILQAKKVMINNLTGVGIPGQSHDFAISAYPNPFRDLLFVSFDVVENQNISLDITDLKGRLISTIFEDKEFPQGSYIIELSTLNSGMELSPGVYFCRIRTGNTTKVIKLFKN